MYKCPHSLEIFLLKAVNLLCNFRFPLYLLPSYTLSINTLSSYVRSICILSSKFSRRCIKEIIGLYFLWIVLVPSIKKLHMVQQLIYSRRNIKSTKSIYEESRGFAPLFLRNTATNPNNPCRLSNHSVGHTTIVKGEDKM
jgi:hypothetical protein